MGTFALIFIILLTLPVLADTIDKPLSSQQKAVIAAMIAENVSPIVAKTKSFAEPKVPDLKQVRQSVFEILEAESLKGDVAYFFIRSIFCSGVEAKAVFGPRILEKLQDYSLSIEEAATVGSFLNGRSALGCDQRVNAVENRAPGPAEMFNLVESFLQGLPGFFPNKNKILSATELTRTLILGSANDSGCYGSDPSCVWSANSGLIGYLSDQLKSDQDFLIHAIRFYARLTVLQGQHPHGGDFSVFDSADRNMWDFALQSVEGNPFEAIRVLTVFSHDQCCNSLPVSGPMAPFLDLLNDVSPTASHSDDPESLLHVPGALNGADVPPSIIAKFARLKKRYRALYGDDPSFRAGYYHVYGGALTASELLRHGLGSIDGVKFSTFISEGLGYFYKKFTMPLHMSGDTQILWEQIGEDEWKNPVVPKGWAPERFQKANLELEILKEYLEFTRAQHKAGAEFVYKLFLR